MDYRLQLSRELLIRKTKRLSSTGRQALTNMFAPLRFSDVVDVVSQMCARLDTGIDDDKETLLEAILKEKSFRIWQRLAEVFIRNHIWPGTPVGLLCALRFHEDNVQTSLDGKNNQATMKNFAGLHIDSSANYKLWVQLLPPSSCSFRFCGTAEMALE